MSAHAIRSHAAEIGGDPSPGSWSLFSGRPAGRGCRKGTCRLMQCPPARGTVQSSQGSRTALYRCRPSTTGEPWTCVLCHTWASQIAEPNALICFAGPRVIEQTIRGKAAPTGFQRAEYSAGSRDAGPGHVRGGRMREELIGITRMLVGLDPAWPATCPRPQPASDSAEAKTAGGRRMSAPTRMRRREHGLGRPILTRMMALAPQDPSDLGAGPGLAPA